MKDSSGIENRRVNLLNDDIDDATLALITAAAGGFAKSASPVGHTPSSDHDTRRTDREEFGPQDQKSAEN